MARPRKKKHGPRSKMIIVRVNDDEQASIRANAKSAGLRLSEFVRRALLDGRVIVRVPTAFGMSVAFQLRKIGINLNQSMSIAHANGEVPEGLAAVIKQIEKILNRMIDKD